MAEGELKKHRVEKKPPSSSKGEAMPEMPAEELAVKSLEAEHVHRVYSAIASHFSATRYKAWPEVEGFVKGCRPGEVLVDVGSGNGKNVIIAPKGVVGIACDYSGELLALGRDRGAESVRCDGLRTALKSGCADVVLSIAVIHHFATPERRVAAVAELGRLLRPGGRGIIYVWAREQAKDRGGTDVLINWEVHAKFDTEQSVLQRYYHLFVKGELEDLVAQVPGLAVRRSYFDKENWAVVVERVVDAPASGTSRQDV